MQVNLTKQILELIRNYAYKQGISISEFARKSKISKAWLSRLKNYDANLSLETATYLLDVIGYKLTVQKKGSTAASIKPKRKVPVEARSRLKKVIECQNI